jgi:hypothetical protein
MSEDVFNGTVFTQGEWGSGGYDGVGFYTGGTVSTGTATLTGTASAYGDPIAATLNGVSMTLLAYADFANGEGIVLTSQDLGTFYVFTNIQYDPGTYYTLYYGFGDFSAPCFVTGTRIATARGEVAVESLRVGDRVVALRGQRFAPITWIGRRRLECRNHRRGHDIWPVRIAAGAFAADMPHRDLLLSPDHAVYMEGALVPVRYLLNGATVVQSPVAGVTYWHIQLAAHDVLLAEGLPTESYLDTGNRAAFDNHDAPPDAATVHSHPALARRMWLERACAPLHTDPAQLVGIKQRLLARAGLLGHAITDEPDLSVLVNGKPVPLRRSGFAWQARLPAGTRQARLVSRSAVPSEMSIDSTDHRRLGIAVTYLALDGELIGWEDSRLGDGWHAPEAHARWTNGDGLVRCDPGGTRLLELKAAPLHRYWLSRRPLAPARADIAA